MKTDLTPMHLTKKNLRPISKGPEDSSPIQGKDPKSSSKNSPDYKLELSSKLPPLPSVPLPDTVPTKVEIKETKAPPPPPEVKKVKDGSVKSPAIIFIKGLDVFSSPSKSEGGYAGVGRLAEGVEGSRIYGWSQKSEIIDEIKKTHKDYPVILVGHSLGGDTAVDIANELDSLEHQFRKVDLLVTIDAIGFNNDIIPQNVGKHLNVFGETSLFLNDGPHVARRREKTDVENILSPLDHTDIDDDKGIQYEIINVIQKALVV